MIRKVSHIGIAVKNFDEAIKLYKDAFGLEAKAVEVVQEQKVRVATIPIGEVRFELLEPTDAEGPIAKFIEGRGEGVHHIALETDDIVSALQSLKEKGLKLIDEKPRIGAHKAKIGFIHPKSMRGVLYELCEEAVDDLTNLANPKKDAQ